jgi:YfiH family protein
LIEQQHQNVSYLQFHHYQQFPTLTHGIFTRQGGFSQAPYQGLNTLGSLNGGDKFDNVIRNRQLVLQALNLHDYPCATLWNIHGADVKIYNSREHWRTDWACHSYYETPWQPESIRQGDAIITQERGVAMALSFADCTPILLYDPIEQVGGIAHGGWRGTARGVVFATIEAMYKRFGSLPSNIYAGIGPAIGECCYEITQQVQEIFSGQRHFDEMPTHEHYRELVRESVVFSTLELPERMSLRLNLEETNRRQLLMAGLRSERIEVSGICTSCHKDRFFSHRAEHGRTGRFPTVVALKNE